MPWDDLFAEAQRQLSICNSCRYCAGYCPVWPALELRTELRRADVTYLASLCHDCQSCLSACMYAPPHEFGVSPPQLFSRVRADTYRRYVWPARTSPALAGWRGLLAGFAATCVLLAALALLVGPGPAPAAGGLPAGNTAGSPYQLLPHLVLLIVVLIPAIWTLGIMARAAWRYWQDINGRIGGLLDVRAWGRTLWQAATLRHQAGGQDGCTYPGSDADEKPSAARPRWHHLVAYGFLLTFASTVAAWILQTFLGEDPPYPLLSVPVLTGAIGGAAASAGCAGLIALKRRADQDRSADYAMLWALLALMLTGLAVLATRTTPLFAPVLVVHLAAVIVAFAIAPYTGFFHWVYRTLSIQHSNLEQRARHRD